MLGQQGAQGAILKATARDGTIVALKVYNPNQVEERTQREVGAVKKLTGDSMVRIHNAGAVTITGKDFRFFATASIDGEALSDRVARIRRSIPFATAIRNRCRTNS